MAQKPDGKPAKTERVTFTRPAAERIAKVVRTVEAGDRDSAALRFGHRDNAGPSRAIRICTFTAPWAIGTVKTVAFSGQTATPNTALVTNLFFPVGGNVPMDGAIARDGGSWYLIDVPFITASAVYVAGFSVSASLNTNSCAITVTTTASTASVTFLRIGVI
jgi:hypothetical protein